MDAALTTPAPLLVAALPAKSLPITALQLAVLDSAVHTQQGIAPVAGGHVVRLADAGAAPALTTAVAEPMASTPPTRADAAPLIALSPAGQPGKAAPAAPPEAEATLGLPIATRPLRLESGRTAPSAVLAARPAAGTPEEIVTIDVERPYTPEPGETLQQVALHFNTTTDELIKRNPGLGISPERPIPQGFTLKVPAPEARVYLDDTPLTGGPNPYIVQGHSMVPIRRIVEEKGGVVVWLPKTREVNAWANNTFLGVKIGEREARIGTEVYLLPVVPTIRESRTMVPLRYLMTALNLQVEYNPANGTYYLVSRAAQAQ
jgi:LysM repeat protein